ncbi:MAG: aminotransferase class V-fold PLP-dependent enzyme [Bacilli bacterium]
MIYLDNSATTFPKPESVYEALDFANRNLAFNVGRGMYKAAIDGVKIVEKCRNEILLLSNSINGDVVFLSSATESLNLIINGITFQDGDYVYVTPFEHNAIIRPLFNIQKKIRIKIVVLPFGKKTWMPDVLQIEEMFSINKPKAVFVSQVSNVTGLEIEYSQIFEISKKYDSLNILDSAQAYGIIKPNLKYCDYCVFAGHKSLYASFGIAGFIDNSNYFLNITKSGGNGSDSLNHDMPNKGHERYEAGSPNIVAIYGLLKSCQWLKEQNIYDHEKELISYFIDKVSQNKKIILYLPNDKRSLGIVSFNIVGYLCDDVSSILNDEFNICVRAGYHCCPFIHGFISSKEFHGTVRISVSAFNSIDDIDTLIAALDTF